MKEKMEHYFNKEKHSPKDIKFFICLIKKYNLKENFEYLIISLKDNREIYIPKMKKIFINGKMVKIEDNIKEIFAKENEHEE